MLIPILDAAAEVIRSHPERARPDTGWPCCEWVGRVGLYAAGAVRGPTTYWQQMCIHDAGTPWSPVEAAASLVRLAVGRQSAPGYVVTPSGGWGDAQVARVLEGLVVGRWHVVQRWTRLQPDGTARGLTSGGHTILLRYDGDGVGLRLESSVRDGVRLGGSPWRGGPPTVGPESIREWLSVARAGVGVCPLWDGA